MRRLKCLQKLQLRGCRKLCDADVEDAFISSMAFLKNPKNDILSPLKLKDKAIDISNTVHNPALLTHSKIQTDENFQLRPTLIFPALTSLNLLDCCRLTDRGVAAFCKELGTQLTQLALVDCKSLTDYSGMIIGKFCSRLRELDLSGCGNFSDAVVHSLAPRISCLTTLRLDGNRNITTKGLLLHIDKEV